MADETITIGNITPATFEKYIAGRIAPDFDGPREAEEPALVLGPTKNWKICYDPSNKSYIREVRPPYMRKVPNANNIIIDMVDRNKKNILIEFQDGERILALKMDPNPESLIINSSKIINRYNTMTRWVEENWGDEIDNITFSGSTYSFTVTSNNERIGLAVISRNHSEAYRFLKKLVEFYRTNGYLYQDETGYTMERETAENRNQHQYQSMNRYLLLNPSSRNNHPRDGLLRERLYIRIKFDFVTFYGYFESFDVTEDQASPWPFSSRDHASDCLPRAPRTPCTGGCPSGLCSSSPPEHRRSIGTP